MTDHNLPSNRIYGFALGGTGKLLYRLRNLDCCYLVFPNNLDMYLDMLRKDQPKYILGLGSYSGTDQDKIRIETVCTNQFRNEFIRGDSLQRCEIKPFISPNQSMKIADAIGNSYCNLVSWKVTRLIYNDELSAQYTFLHVPKKMKPWVISPKIDQALQKVLN